MTPERIRELRDQAEAVARQPHCGCESCYCGNFDDAMREGAWRADRDAAQQTLSLLDAIDAAEARLAKAKAVVEDLAAATILANGRVIGIERHHVEAARAALNRAEKG